MSCVAWAARSALGAIAVLIFCGGSVCIGSEGVVVGNLLTDAVVAGTEETGTGVTVGRSTSIGTGFCCAADIAGIETGADI